MTLRTAAIAAGALALAGCASQWQKRTVETHATSTAQVTAERVETAKATTSQDTKGTREVRAGKSVVPRADGGWDVTWYFDELTRHEGETKREEVATVKVEAKAAKADDTNTKTEERRPRRWWPTVVALLGAVALIVVFAGPAAWRLVKRTIWK